MKIDPVWVPYTAVLATYSGLPIQFKLRVPEIGKLAEGKGELWVVPDEEDNEALVKLKVRMNRTDETGRGSLRFEEFYLTEDEVARIRPLSPPDLGIECSDLRS